MYYMGGRIPDARFLRTSYMMWAVLATPTPTDIATLHNRDRACKMFVGSAYDQDMPKGNDPTTQLHVELAVWIQPRERHC